MCNTHFANMPQLLLCGLIITLLQGTLVSGQGPKIGSKNNFKDFKNLPSLRCNANGFGSTGKLLKNRGRINQVEKLLPTSDQKQLFKKIRNNKDFDLTNLSEDDILVIFKRLMGLSEDSKNQFIDLSKKWETMTSAQRKLIFKYPKAMIILEESVFCSIQEESTEDELSEYCTRLGKESVSTSDLLTSLDRCPYCAALLVDRRTDSSNAWTSSRSKCEALMEKISQRFPDAWDVDYLRICPMITKAEDLKRISKEKFCTAAQLEKFADDSFGEKLPEEILGVIGKIIVDCKGDLASWTKEEIKKFLRYIVRLPLKLLKPLKFTAIVDVIDDILEEDDLQETFFLQVAARKITNNWATETESLLQAVKTKLLCVVLSASANRKMIDKDVTVGDLETFLRNAKSQCEDLKIRPSAIKRVIGRIIRQPGFAWNQGKLNIFMKQIGHLTPSVVKQIPTQLFCDNWGDIKDGRIPTRLLPLIFEKCSSTFGEAASFTCNTLKQLGPLLVFMPRTVFTAIPDNVVGACITSISDDIDRFCETYTARCRAIMDKVVAYATDENKKLGIILAELGTKLAGSVRSFDDVELEDFGGVDGIKEDKEYRPAMARALLKLIEGEIGPFNSSNPEFCDKFPKLRPLMVVAGDDSMWDNVCEDGNLIENIAAAAPDIGEMSSSNIESIIEKLLRVFNAKNKKAVCVDKSLIDRVAVFLLFARPEDILAFDKKTRMTILRAIGSNWGQVRRLNPKKVKFLTSMNEGLSKNPKITEEDVDASGVFALCGMTKDQVNKLDDNTLRRFFRRLLSCPDIDEEILQELVKKLKSVTEDFNEDYLPKMGAAIAFVLDLLTADQKQERKEVIVSYLREFSEKIKERLEKIRESDDRVITPAKKKEYRDKYLAAMRELITFAIEVKTTNQEATRRKRAAGDLDCSILADIADTAEALTVSQINGMDTAEVKKCLSELSQTSWDTSQCEAWRSHMVSANGLGSTPSAWDKTDLQGLGTLVDCLTPSEVRSLDVDESVLTVLGQTNLQKAADVIAAYMSTSQPNLATLSDSTITNMGHMFCGLSTAQISKLPPTALLTSAKDLSELPCTSVSQREVVANAIGLKVGIDWSGLDPFLVQELGVWIGGLATNEFQTFGTEHIKQISTEAIKAMSALQISLAFDSDEFGEFTREQMDALSPQQIQQLPQALQDIVKDNSDYNIDDDIIDVTDGTITTVKPANGVGSPMTSLPVILIVGLVTFWLY